MKFFYTCVLIALASLLSAVEADEGEAIRALSKICQKEVHSTYDELKKFFTNDMKAEYATDTIKCHIKCMLEKRGNLKDGKFNEKSVVESAKNIAHLKDHINDVTKIAANCKGQKVVNDCETAYNIVICFKNNKVALGIPRLADELI